METLMIGMLLLLGCGTLALQLMAAVLIREAMNGNAGKEAEARAELPEEVEQRRAAAEAQRLYEQGFVNLMRYDGSPGGKERERQ